MRGLCWSWSFWGVGSCTELEVLVCFDNLPCKCLTFPVGQVRERSVYIETWILECLTSPPAMNRNQWLSRKTKQHPRLNRITHTQTKQTKYASTFSNDSFNYHHKHTTWSPLRKCSAIIMFVPLYLSHEPQGSLKALKDCLKKKETKNKRHSPPPPKKNPKHPNLIPP